VRIVILAQSLSSNALGRVYCLWLVACELGAHVDVVGPADGGLWPVLAETPFAQACRAVQARPDDPVVADLVAEADVLIAAKPLRASFGLGLALARRHRRPLVLDIDDPDLAVRMARRSRRARLGLVGMGAIRRGTHPLQYWRLHRDITRTSRLVSNPVLQRRYGGRILPHVRPPMPDGRPHGDGGVRVAFVGSPRAHKGLSAVREAVAALADEGFTLDVTAERPEDAAPWERWRGLTDLATGQELVAAADVVAIPLLPESFGASQLPVKLIDAMMAGRAVVATDLEVLRWATEGSALLVPPNDTNALREALATLRDPAVRSRMGAAARAIALERYTPAAGAPTLAAAIDDARPRV
jgi:glycosyltransferase involved in cell wall biosynthesis